MLLIISLLTPLIGILFIATDILKEIFENAYLNVNRIKYIGLAASLVNVFICLITFIFYDSSNNQFQFVSENHDVNGYNLFFGVDGLSIYFVVLTAIIIPVAILSNWTSISDKLKWYILILLLLEILLLVIFVVLDIFFFYVFFESILPPLFILIGIYGSSNRVRASFYLFLYTLLGSLFLLLSILTINSNMGTTDLDILYKNNFNYFTQLFLFYGVFIAFAVKTPTIFLNTWLLKAHVESPLGGSIILAGIVLKLSLYGIFRLILPILPKASLNYTYIVFLIGALTILYASISTLRTIDVKELIAYSSVSHAAVYLLGVFSNTIQGIEGGIILGLAHGFVSSGLFICAGGVLYDRTRTRLIIFYKGIVQLMPLFAILFFILCLSNAGTPLSLNFIGEFLSLYGTFERLPILGAIASSSIVFSAAYTIFMFNRISFAGKYSKFFKVNISDLNKREFVLLLTLVLFTVIFGIYPAPIFDGIHYSVSSLIYSAPWEFFSFKNLLCDSYLISINKYNYNTYLILFSIILIVVYNIYSGFLQILLSKVYNSLEWCLNSLPKPHAFVSSPLMSAPGSGGDDGSEERRIRLERKIEKLEDSIEKLEDEKDFFDRHVELCRENVRMNNYFISTAGEEGDLSEGIKDMFERENEFDSEDWARYEGRPNTDAVRDETENRELEIDDHAEMAEECREQIETKRSRVEDLRSQLNSIGSEGGPNDNPEGGPNDNPEGGPNDNPEGESGISCDAPDAWGLYFQDSDSPQIDPIVELHNNIMFYLFVILLSVGWIMISIVRNYAYGKSAISNKYLNHGTLIELIWTITPALIIILVAFPSFKLLYLMDEVTDPSLTIGINGHQWYWSYEYPEFSNSDGNNLEFGYLTSNSVPELISNVLLSDSDSNAGSSSSSDSGNSDASSEGAAPSNTGDPDDPNSNNNNNPENESQDGSEVMTCAHGSESWCQLCHEKESMDRIGKCRHDWVIFNHGGDDRVLGARCDFAPNDDPHDLDPNNEKAHSIIYFCNKCLSTSCAHCVDLSHPDSFSSSSDENASDGGDDSSSDENESGGDNEINEPNGGSSSSSGGGVKESGGDENESGNDENESGGDDGDGFGFEIYPDYEEDIDFSLDDDDE